MRRYSRLIALIMDALTINEREAMTCFQCGKGKMTSKLAEIVADVRGEQIPVKTTAMVCSRCGFQALTEEQSDAYTIASADAYRRKHGLLTSQERTREEEVA